MRPRPVNRDVLHCYVTRVSHQHRDTRRIHLEERSVAVDDDMRNVRDGQEDGTEVACIVVRHAQGDVNRAIQPIVPLFEPNDAAALLAHRLEGRSKGCDGIAHAAGDPENRFAARNRGEDSREHDEKDYPQVSRHFNPAVQTTRTPHWLA